MIRIVLQIVGYCFHLIGVSAMTMNCSSEGELHLVGFLPVSAIYALEDAPLIAVIDDTLRSAANRVLQAVAFMFTNKLNYSPFGR